MAVRRIVCLANSYKNGGRCVAGIEIVNGGFGPWIRPVSNRPARAINIPELTCTDGNVCAPLDVLDIDFGAPMPEAYQSENVLITPGVRWVKSQVAPVGSLIPALDPGLAPLWPHTESTYNGQNDKITTANLAQIGSSLALVRPQAATVRVFQNPYKEAGKLDVRVRFTWGGEVNDLKLTDPVRLDAYQAAGVGNYDVVNPTMCVSIGEVFAAQNEAYKLVAGLIL